MVASTVVDGLHAFNSQEDHTEPRCVQCSPDASIILQTLHPNPMYPGLGPALAPYLVEARLLCQLLALLCCGGHSAPAIPQEVQHLHTGHGRGMVTCAVLVLAPVAKRVWFPTERVWLPTLPDG
jgi:hypothetical protein